MSVISSLPLKWAGGKRWLVPELEKMWALGQKERFVDLFCGGLSVPIGLGLQNVLANDLNPHVMNFFKQVQDGLVPSLPVAYDETMYYEYRRKFNDLIRSGNAYTPLGAELFYYLNRTGFNGLCRFNKSGEYNVPFGRYTKVKYRRSFADVQHVIKDWELTSTDFEEVALEPTDFVYADPPYDGRFTSFTPQGFDWDDQIRLAEYLTRHKGPVVASNLATERIVELYTELGFSIRYVMGPRRISSDGDRTPAKEILAIKGIENEHTS